MILKTSNRALLFIIFAVFSCSEKEDSQAVFTLSISEKKEFHLGQGGLTPEGNFLMFLDSSKTKGSIYNRIVHSLDSVFISKDSAWSKDGDFMEREGPFGVGTVFAYLGSPNYTVYVNSQQLYRQNNESKEVSRKFFQEYGVFGDLEYPAVSLITSAREFSALDRENHKAYFIYDFDNRIQALGYDIQKDSMFTLPVKLDSAKYFNTRLIVKVGNATLTGSDDPQLTVANGKLIVSYPTFSDILVYDFKSKNQDIFTPKSKSFPGSKVLPANYVKEVESTELIDQWMEDWRNQVRFSSITYLVDHNVYIRTVKGGNGLFLEVFDESFSKVDELNLSEVNKDLSNAYVVTKYGLLFRAKDQPVEEVMYYYNVNLSESK